MGKDQKLQTEMARIEEFLPKIKARHGQLAADHLLFNTLNYTQLKFSVIEADFGWFKKGERYIGEWSA